MKASIIKISLLGLLAIAIAGLPVSVSAKDTNAPAAEKKEIKAKKSGVLPFHGKIKAVDQSAKTISVGEQTIQVTSETKIEKAGKPAMLADGVVGEDVAGAYKKTEDGKLHATLVRFGPKVVAEEKAEKKKKEKEATH